jgi:hypothetical protein
LSDDSRDNDNLIQFPQLRVVPIESPEGAASIMQLDHALSLVEHDGRMYDLAGLIRHLSPQELRELDAAAPRSGQALWDEVVRRWPALAAEIVAGAQPVG